MPSHLTKTERALLEAIDNEEVTWRRTVGVHGPTKTSYRRWTTEEDYVLVTRVAKRLDEKGLLRHEMAAGYSYITRGPLLLSAAGKAALSDAIAETAPIQAP